jgi:hypothetical protein
MIPSLIVFYAPAKFAILTVVLLALIDTRFGLKLAKFKKIEITSNRASDFFAKLVGYFVFITFGLFLNAEFNMPYIVWISAIIPIYSEIFSIDEKQRQLGKNWNIKTSGKRLQVREEYKEQTRFVEIK